MDSVSPTTRRLDRIRLRRYLLVRYVPLSSRFLPPSHALSVDPLLARYTRLNKSGVITTSPITSIKWLPPSSPLSSPEGASADFMTSHADGTIIMWNKDREDWSGFVPRPSYPIRSGSGKENVDVDGEEGREKVGGAEGRDMDMVVTRPAAVDKKGVGTSKFNPVRHWRVSSKALAGE
jgi:hypothetical protein